MRDQKWFSVVAKFYYIFGILYYAYSWLFVIGLAGIVTTFIFSGIHYYVFAIIIGNISLVIIIGGIVLWVRAGKFQVQSSNPCLKILFLERTYIVLDNNRYEYSRKLIAEALRSGVEIYKSHFKWSGKGNIYPRIANHRQNISISSSPVTLFDICKINFERPLREGEKLEINYSYNLEDTGNEAKPYLAHDTHDKVDKLILRVKIFTTSSPQLYSKRILMSSTSEIPILEVEEPFIDSLGYKEAVWAIKKPRLGCRYQIVWE